MRMCLRLKLDTHGEVRRKLLASGERRLVEDCSARGRRVNNLFWVAVRVPDSSCLLGYAWEGRNMLGRLWMEERAMLQALIT